MKSSTACFINAGTLVFVLLTLIPTRDVLPLFSVAGIFAALISLVLTGIKLQQDDL